MAKKRITAAQLALAPGMMAEVTDDDGKVTLRTVTSEPWQLGGHTWVIMLDGISGAYALERCKPVKVRPASA